MREGREGRSDGVTRAWTKNVADRECKEKRFRKYVNDRYSMK